MPRLIISEQARLNVAEMTGFLIEADAVKQAIKVAKLLNQGFEKVDLLPNMGKSVESDLSDNIRQYNIGYGKAGYSFIYHHYDIQDTVTILAVKHWRQKNYH